MAKEPKSLITQNEDGKTSRLSVRDEVDILLTEYNRLGRQAQMYVEQLSPRFTIFAIFVLSSLAFAFQGGDHEIVYPIIPLFVFLLTSITASQFQLLGMIDRRLRGIEDRIKELNGGEGILKYETEFALKHIYTYTTDRRFKYKWLSKWIPTPQVLAVVFMVMSFLPLVGISTYKTFFLWSRPWNFLYVIAVIFSSILIIVDAFAFFSMGRNLDDTKSKKAMSEDLITTDRTHSTSVQNEPEMPPK